MYVSVLHVTKRQLRVPGYMGLKLKQSLNLTRMYCISGLKVKIRHVGLERKKRLVRCQDPGRR